MAIPLGRSHLPQDRVGGERTIASTAVRAEVYVQEALRWLPTDDTTEVTEKAEVSPQFPHGGRILIADDNPDMRAYVSRLL